MLIWQGIRLLELLILQCLRKWHATSDFKVLLLRSEKRLDLCAAIYTPMNPFVIIKGLITVIPIQGSQVL